MAPLALVTGASSGIGQACATRLVDLGFHVLAGVRNLDDAPERTEAVKLDVTSEGDVAAAAERVGAELHVLVNNAGTAVSGPVEVVPVGDWRRQLEINLIGQVAVTRALLPAVLRTRGHIVNMSSIGGRVANPLFGPYSASKFALEGMSDALRREVSHLGVRVVVVEPGGIATPIWDKGHAVADQMLEGADPEAAGRYGDLIANVRRAPEAVAEVVGKAVTTRRPRARYVVGRQAQVQAVAARLLPDRVFDALVARYLRR
jgi:NAD(P)-dependent dehydrogenase (short-subunit alcohol dehydrogenase family)